MRTAIASPDPEPDPSEIHIAFLLCVAGKLTAEQLCNLGGDAFSGRRSLLRMLVDRRLVTEADIAEAQERAATYANAPHEPPGVRKLPHADEVEVLEKGKVITPEQAAAVRSEAERIGASPDSVLIRLGYATSYQILMARAYLHNMKAVDLLKMPPTPEALSLLPAAVAREHKVVPISRVTQGGADFLAIAVADPAAIHAVDAARAACGMKVVPFLAPAEQVAAVIEVHYSD